MKTYMDFVLVPSNGVPPAFLAQEVVKCVHALLSEMPGSLALALPDCKSGATRQLGKRVRVFSMDEVHLEALADTLESNPRFAEQIIPGRLRHSPENPSEWVAYTRFRLPNRRRQKKDSDAYAVRRQQLRAERIAIAETLPVLHTFSRSNGHQYGMGIDVLSAYFDELPEQGRLTSYGLSHRSAPFWLPKV